MKLLLAEDEAALRKTVAEALRQRGCVVEVAIDFSPAAEQSKLYRYDCVLVGLTDITRWRWPRPGTGGEGHWLASRGTGAYCPQRARRP